MNTSNTVRANAGLLVRCAVCIVLLCSACWSSGAGAQSGLVYVWQAYSSPFIVQSGSSAKRVANAQCSIEFGQPYALGIQDYESPGFIGGPCCNSPDPDATNLMCNGEFEIAWLPTPGPKDCGCPSLPSSPPQQNQGKPINTATGVENEAEVDYQGSGAYPLLLRRYFSSVTGTSSPMAAASLIGNLWRHSYDRSLVSYPTAYPNPVVTLARPNGQGISFTLSNGNWITDADVADKLAPLANACGVSGNGWTLTLSPSDEVETYNVNGQLCSITNRAGLTQSLAYDSQNRIASASDPFGRNLVFAYDALNRISTITDPASNTIAYQYDPTYGNLVSVTYQDGKTRSYVYENSAYPWYLTGIIDEDGQRYLTATYYADGGANTEQLAGGADLVTVTDLTAGGHMAPSVTVTDALGTARTFTSVNILGVQKNTGVSLPGPSVTTMTIGYNANGFVASEADFNGNVTTFQYQDPYGRLNLETQRVEASGSPQQRTINTTWSPNFSLRTQIVEPLRTTNMGYDSAGNMLSKSIVAGSETRTWTYTYDTAGQMLTMIGPRTDVNQITTYTYDSQENLSSVTNALGQTSYITSYDAHGKPLSMTDPNDLVTQMTYDARQRLLTRNVGGEVTTNTYDAAGQITQVTRPDGSYIAYTYDAAHRLTGIGDSMGNSIAYTLDAMGNRIQENVYDATSTLAQTKSRVFDMYSRLYQEIGAVNETTTYQYDNQGNLVTLTDPNGNNTANTYDALNRLAKITDQLSGNVNYGFDSLDQLIKISDQRGLTTQYAIDGLGNLNQVQSPDTGTANATYDAAGNVLTKTDAEGQVTTYTYDALNRITSISYSTGPALNATFTYDQGTNGISHLTGISDNAGTIAYAYDQHGRVTSENRTMNGVSYLTGYNYDSAGRLAGVNYPSGRQVAYTRDGDGRISGITTTMAGVTQTVLANASYRPFGPEQVLNFGNNQTYTRTYDLDGRIASYTLPTQTMTLGYDPGSRITSITSSANTTNPFSVGYDPLNRLTSFAGPSVAETFGYDAIGNRTQLAIGAGSYSNTYSTVSNQIASSSGPTPKTYTFDANGSIVGDSFNTFVYDARERMKQVTNTGGTTQYVVNALGQRVEKATGTAATMYHYDTNGHLIAESDPTGKVQAEYIYLNDVPVGVFK